MFVRMPEYSKIDENEIFLDITRLVHASGALKLLSYHDITYVNEIGYNWVAQQCQ